MFGRTDSREGAKNAEKTLKLVKLLFQYRPSSRGDSLRVALLALLTALVLATAVPAVIAAELAPFSSDGCSLFPDGTLAERTRWCDCCLTHDIAYWQGGSAAEREAADAALRACVREKTGDANLAETM
ncbi:MAG TPA: hypothetical protein DEB35_12385, partial [Desulfuromonas sp.]|nr:hypothetical protein [Desulfuromonas sp.]